MESKQQTHLSWSTVPDKLVDGNVYYWDNNTTSWNKSDSKDEEEFNALSWATNDQVQSQGINDKVCSKK